VVLTTHRMDEAEALCDKIAIQVNGKMVCFGSPQHLKQKYGQGYKVDVKLPAEIASNALDQHFSQVLPFMQRVGEKNEEGIVEFKILIQEFKLSAVFHHLLVLQEQKQVLDFVISKSNLETVFLHFARYQHGHRDGSPL